MKKLIYIAALYCSTTSAKIDCFKHMSNIDLSTVTLQKKCNLIIRDWSKKEVLSVKTCFSKLEKSNIKTSYALVANINYSDGKTNTSIMHTRVATETAQNISIELLTASPELLTSYKHYLIYDKLKDTLSLKKEERLLFFSPKEKYNLKLECK